MNIYLPESGILINIDLDALDPDDPYQGVIVEEYEQGTWEFYRGEVRVSHDRIIAP